MENYQNYRATMKESLLRRGTWKVWIQTPHGAGYLRQGFAWKTRLGAERATQAHYPGINWISEPVP